jgi:hypothetical protein
MLNKESMGCKSPGEHDPRCSCLRCKPREGQCNGCQKLSVQHEIPQCIAKQILKIDKYELSNHTHLESIVCNNTNDKNVKPILREMLRQQANGVVFTAEMVLTYRKQGLFRQDGSTKLVLVNESNLAVEIAPRI